MKLSLANWKKTIYYLKRNGLRNTILAAGERLGAGQEHYVYREPTAQELCAQRARVFAGKPEFSIVVPLYRTPRVYLTELLDSVMCQTYPHFELILADATPDESVAQAVREYAAAGGVSITADSSASEEGAAYDFTAGAIVYRRLTENGGISRNTNEALQYAAGDYVGLLDHDDVLTADALYCMAEQIEACAQAGQRAMLLYSDEDKCNQDRTVYYEPHYKTDFNRELLYSNNYICHFLVMKRELIQELSLRPEYDGAQDYDLVLRAAEKIPETSIVHIPRVLYHWRCHTGSTAENPQSKMYAYEAGKRALQDAADRQGINAYAEHLKHLGFYRLVYEPDILQARPDVGAVGRGCVQGSALTGARLTCGPYDAQGQALYEGLRSGYSGYMHRAVLGQDAEAADIRRIRVRTECRVLFEQAVGVPYRESADGYFDWTILDKDTDYRAVSMALGQALREAGWRVVWLPAE